MTPTVVPPESEDQKSPLEILRDPLGTLVREYVDGDTDPEKIAQYRLARRNFLFFEGKQNIAPIWLSTGIADYSATGAPLSPGSKGSDQGQFDYPFNFIRGDGLKAIAVTGKAPVCRAVPDDPNDDSSVNSARDAEAVAAHLRYQWKIDALQKRIMYVLWTLGPCYAYVRYRSDGLKYGYTAEPVIGTQEVPISDGGYQCFQCGQLTNAPEQPDLFPCPVCGHEMGAEAYHEPQTVPVPAVVGMKQYENGSVEVDLGDIFTVTTQFDSETLDDTLYLLYERDVPKASLMAIYPGLRKKHGEHSAPSDQIGSAGKMVGTDARRVMTSASGIPYTRKDRWRYSLYWLRPAIYEYCPDDKIRAYLKENFKEGLRAAFVEGELQDVRIERISDHWVACLPSVSRRLNSDPLCNDAIPGQELYNDGQALASETLYRGIPATVVDKKTFDVAAMNNRAPSPAELIGVNLEGKDPNKLAFNLPTARFSDQLMPWLAGMRADTQEIIGVNRTLAGMEGNQQQTAEEARLRMNAALKQLSIPYDNTRAFHAEILDRGVRLMAKYGAQEIQAPAKRGLLGFETRKVDLKQMAEIGYHFEPDEGMPASFSDERDRMVKYLTEAPMLADASGLTHPYNATNLNAHIGFPGLYTPGENERRKIRHQIDQLLQEQPIQQPGPIDMMTGQPGPPVTLPSIPPDEFEDNHQFAADVLKAWCNTDEGMAAREQNKPGYDNVVAFGKAHEAMIPPPLPPPGKGAPAAPPGGPPPPNAKTVNAPPPGPMPNVQVGTPNPVPAPQGTPPPPGQLPIQ